MKFFNRTVIACIMIMGSGAVYAHGEDGENHQGPDNTGLILAMKVFGEDGGNRQWRDNMEHQFNEFQGWMRDQINQLNQRWEEWQRSQQKPSISHDKSALANCIIHVLIDQDEIASIHVDAGHFHLQGTRQVQHPSDSFFSKNTVKQTMKIEIEGSLEPLQTAQGSKKSTYHLTIGGNVSCENRPTRQGTETFHAEFNSSLRIQPGTATAITSIGGTSVKVLLTEEQTPGSTAEKKEK